MGISQRIVGASVRRAMPDIVRVGVVLAKLAANKALGGTLRSAQGRTPSRWIIINVFRLRPCLGTQASSLIPSGWPWLLSWPLGALHVLPCAFSADRRVKRTAIRTRLRRRP